MLPTFPDSSTALCTCADFARRGLGTCKHIEAADRWLANHPDALPAPAPIRSVSPEAVWQEIDRRLEREAKAPLPASRGVREAGAALYDTAR